MIPSRLLLGFRVALDTVMPAPHRDRHFIHLLQHDVVYARVPKVANSTLKRLLAAHLELPGIDGVPVNRDLFWRMQSADAVAMRTAWELERLQPQPFVFAVVRNPFDRILSCYESKLQALPHDYAALGPGFAPGMDFGAFLDRVAAIPDRIANVHFRSQSAILCHRGKLVPGFVARLETIAEDWSALQRVCCDRGLMLSSWPDAEPRPQVRRIGRDAWTPQRIALVRKRYAADFAILYPDAADPD